MIVPPEVTKEITAFGKFEETKYWDLDLAPTIIALPVCSSQIASNNTHFYSLSLTSAQSFPGLSYTAADWKAKFLRIASLVSVSYKFTVLLTCCLNMIPDIHAPGRAGWKGPIMLCTEITPDPQMRRIVNRTCEQDGAS
ncbi:cytochrome p450, partial [Moniliophthora roreri]